MFDQITPFIQLGGTVITVVLFLYYLQHRDREERDSRAKVMADTLTRVEAIAKSEERTAASFATVMAEANKQSREIVDDILAMAKDMASAMTKSSSAVDELRMTMQQARQQGGGPGRKGPHYGSGQGGQPGN